MTAPTHANPSVALSKLADGTLDGDWKLDPGKSSVRLKSASMWGLVKVNGTFSDLSGDATVTGGAVTSARVLVGSASIDTKNAKRDKHLRSKDFFDSEKHPSIVFELNSVTPSESTASAHGSLTVADVTKPITVEISPSHNADASITLSAEINVDRQDFGLTWNQLGMASMKNAVSITAVFTRS